MICNDWGCSPIGLIYTSKMLNAQYTWIHRFLVTVLFSFGPTHSGLSFYHTLYTSPRGSLQPRAGSPKYSQLSVLINTICIGEVTYTFKKILCLQLLCHYMAIWPPKANIFTSWLFIKKYKKLCWPSTLGDHEHSNWHCYLYQVTMNHTR